MSVRKLLNYSLLHELGKGGMASVWYAENSVGRPYAIKLLNPQLLILESSIADRFRNEAQIMVKLNHPAVRRVEDYYEDGETLAIIMEYLDGQDLNQYIRKNGRVPEELAVKWFVPALDALGYVHQKGYFHRDIKPANLFLTREGEVKVMDFGIAKIVGSDMELTHTSSMMGSPIYMSPEQIVTPKGVDYRTDIYSLGVTLYTLLAGAKPYDEHQQSSFSIQSAIVQNRLQHLPHVSAKINDVIEKATRKDPSERYASCALFSEALLKEEVIEDLDEPTLLGLAPVKAEVPPAPKKEEPLRPAPAPPPVQPKKVPARQSAANAAAPPVKKIPKIDVSFLKNLNIRLVGGIVVGALLLAEMLYLAISGKHGTPDREQTSPAAPTAVSPTDEKGITRALDYYNRQEYDSAFSLLVKYQQTPALSQHPEATTDLGAMYFFGQPEDGSMQPDRAKAEEWLEKGAALQNPRAHYFLGLLADGVDMKTDYYPSGKTPEAIAHYRKAAEGGDVSAQVTLADLYSKGNELVEDEDPCVLLGYLDQAISNPANQTARIVRNDFKKKNLCH